MTLEDVLSVCELLHANDIEVWLDGGWAVDALLGRQTRRHKDLDLVLQQRDEQAMRDFLARRGFREKGEWYAKPWNYVLIDEDGHEIDVHLIRLDARGNGIYGNDRGASYTAHALSGSGIVGDRSVRCIAADILVSFHTGYELTDKDFQDVSALCDEFALDLPEEYGPFIRGSR